VSIDIGYKKKILNSSLILLLISVLPTVVAADPPAPIARDYPTAESRQSVEDEDLFLKIFGYKRKLPDQLVVPFLIGDRQFGNIQIFLARDPKHIRVSADTIFDRITPFVRSSILAHLQTQIDGRNTLSISTLKESGFSVDFDENALLFRIDIPAELRKEKIVGQLEGQAPPNLEYATEPNHLSAYVNISAGHDFVYQGRNATNGDTHSTAVNLDTAINFRNFVAEGIIEYSEENSWRRGDMRLVHDSPERMLRFLVGDLLIPLRGYQTAPAIGGFGISKDFSLQPYARIRPITSNKILISRPSTVEVFLNDILVETVRVQPGPYDFHQTALQHGINDVRIRIRNDLGEEEWVDIDTFFSASSLKKDLSQYSINFGFLRDDNHNNYDYDLNNLITSFFYRRGITDNQTAGFYLQTAPNQMMFGFENDWSSSMGNINANLAFSQTPNKEMDLAGQLIYYYFNNKQSANPHHRSWRASIEYVGRNFARINETDPDNSTSWLLTGSVGQELSSAIYGSLSASYGWSRDAYDLGDSHVFSLNLTKRLTRSARISLTLSERKVSQRAENEAGAFISLTINFPQRGHSFNSTYSTRKNAAGVNWQYRSPNNQMMNMLTVQSSEDTNLYMSERLSYAGHRGNVALTHYHEEPQKSDSQDRTNLAINSALVFVDGEIGLAAPVRNSFVIVKSNDVLKDYKVGINRRRDGSFQGVDDIFGPAAITDLTPYHVHDLKIEIPDLPAGYEINGFDYTLLPTYKSGFLLKIVGEAFVLVQGRLVDEKDEPVRFIEGEVISLDDLKFAPRSFFTNKNGVFTIYGMTPGHFEIHFTSNTWKPLSISIPKNVGSNIYKIGTIITESNNGSSQKISGTGIDDRVNVEK
jgi:outer membrane usher protein